MGALRLEIRRLARKEMKEAVRELKRQVAAIRRRLASTKKRMSDVERTARRAASSRGATAARQGSRGVGARPFGAVVAGSLARYGSGLVARGWFAAPSAVA